MAKEHRHAGVRLELFTHLPAARALEIAMMLALSQQDVRLFELDNPSEDNPKEDNIAEGNIAGDNTPENSPSENDALQLAIVDMRGRPQIVFSVESVSTETRTLVTTRIEDYGTSQWTLDFFIPIWRKQMSGFPAYKRFMAALGRVIKAADPLAEHQIRDAKGAV